MAEVQHWENLERAVECRISALLVLQFIVEQGKRSLPSIRSSQAFATHNVGLEILKLLDPEGPAAVILSRETGLSIHQISKLREALLRE